MITWPRELCRHEASKWWLVDERAALLMLLRERTSELEEAACSKPRTHQLHIRMLWFEFNRSWHEAGIHSRHIHSPTQLLSCPAVCLCLCVHPFARSITAAVSNPSRLYSTSLC